MCAVDPSGVPDRAIDEDDPLDNAWAYGNTARGWLYNHLGDRTVDAELEIAVMTDEEAVSTAQNHGWRSH